MSERATNVEATTPAIADTLIALMAKSMQDGEVVATGVASPLAILAIAVAKKTHAPNLRYLACVGSLDPEIDTLHHATEDLRYLDGRTAEIGIPDLFDHARRGRVGTIFFGAAQVDAYGRTNMSAIGTLDKPKVKLPGVAGAATLRRWVKNPIIVVPKHSARTLVAQVSVISTEDTRRTITMYTNLGVFELGRNGATLISRHPWASYETIRERTGFVYAIKDNMVTPLADDETCAAIRAIDKHELRHSLVG